MQALTHRPAPPPKSRPSRPWASTQPYRCQPPNLTLPGSSPALVLAVLVTTCGLLSWVYVNTKPPELRQPQLEADADAVRTGVGKSVALMSAGGPAAVVGRMAGSQLTRQLEGGMLFSWGLSSNQRTGSRDATWQPAAVLPHLQVVSAAASRHSLIATADGAVWSMGANDSAGGGGHGSQAIPDAGQLGRGGADGPAPVHDLPPGAVAVQVATGRYHSLAVTSDGRVFTWGLNDWGQLGRPGVDAANAACVLGGGCRSGLPGQVALAGGAKAVAASAGRYNSLVLDDQGRLHAWGLDGCASGGAVPAREAAHQPRVVGGELQGRRVVAFDSGYVLWIAATDDGAAFTCSTGDDGYGGTLPDKRVANIAHELGREGPPGVPMPVALPAGEVVVSVAAGREHALVAVSSGDVYAWGGSRRTGGANAAHRLRGDLDGAGPVRLVAAGEYFSLAATENAVFGWGSNGYQQLGFSEDAKVVAQEPRRVTGPLGSGEWRIQGLAAGFQHAMVVAVRAFPAVAGGAGGGATGGGTPAAGGAGVGGGGTTVGGVVGGTSAGGQGSSSVAVDLGVTPVQQQVPGAAGASGSAVGAAAGNASSSGASNVTELTPEQLQFHTSYLESQVRPPNYSPANYSQARGWVPSPRHDLIVDRSRDVFEMLPPQLDARYRNPCWEARSPLDGSPRLLCIPYYNVLGVSKSGTTDLYWRLLNHKGILDGTNKGPHFWDECPYPPKGKCGTGPPGDFSAYVGLFQRCADRIRTQPTAITGEASSNTFTSARGIYLRGWVADRPLNVTLPELLREAQPYLRLIVLMRNPVDRYYSAFHYYRWWEKHKPPPTAEDFHTRAVEETQHWQHCVRNEGQDKCVRRYSPQQLVKGMYAEFLPEWLQHWPRDQLLLLRYEDYRAALPQHLRAVLTFLGVSQPSGEEWATMATQKVRNKNKYDPMLPETRKLLEEFYAPFNQRLAAAMGGDSRWLWQDGRPGPARKEAAAAGDGAGAATAVRPRWHWPR